MGNSYYETLGRDGNTSRARTANWTDGMDAVMLSFMTEEHALGNFVNESESSTPLASTRIIHDFNEKIKLDFNKNRLKNQLKVLKRTYLNYQTLACPSGSGWDYVNNTPLGDPSDWDAIITVC